LILVFAVYLFAGWVYILEKRDKDFVLKTLGGKRSS